MAIYAKPVAAFMSRLANFLVLLRSQLWFVPLLMSLAAIGFALGMTRFGTRLLGDTDFWWLHSGDIGTARDLLSTLLSGMITMTSLVVSVTFIVLTLAAQQLGPRLISIFTGDRLIQVAIGLFLGTIAYILFVLRSLDQSLGPEAVPHLAVTVASALTGTCLLALLFYLHKVARSIVSDYVVVRVSRELRSAIADMLPAAGHESEEDPPSIALPSHAGWLALRQSGYVQTIDYESLVPGARDARAVLSVAVRPGEFVVEGGRHIEVLGSWHDEPDKTDQLRSAIESAFVVGSERTPTQDLEFSIRQLVETALRALSSGINDPFTAAAVIDQLGSAFVLTISRHPQRRLFRDTNGELRVFAKIADPLDLLKEGLRRIRQGGAENAMVLSYLASMMGQIAGVLVGSAETDKNRHVSARAILVSELEAIGETASARLVVTRDRAAVLESVQRAFDQLASVAATRGAGRITTRHRTVHAQANR